MDHRLFRDEFIKEYTDQITTPYQLMNHTQFYKWWRDDKPATSILTRQVSFDIAIKTCRQLGENYSIKAITGVKTNLNYDILVAVNVNMPSTTSDEKLNAISGFLISRYEECRQLNDIYSVHLICVKPGGIQGKLLLGAFLYCLKVGDFNKKGILEVAGGYKNISAFFSYSKMGFQKDLELYGYNCFIDKEVLPMSVDVSEMTPKEIIGYSTGKLEAVVKDDTHLFKTGKPMNDKQEQIQVEMSEVAQEYYVYQLAERYNELGEFSYIIKDRTIESLLHETKMRLNSLFRKYNKCNNSTCSISGGKRKRTKKMKLRKIL
jgi:hypothetical protein